MSNPRLVGDDTRELMKYDRTGGGLHLLRAYLFQRGSTDPYADEVLPKILAALDPIISDLVKVCESPDVAKDERVFLDSLRDALRIKGKNSPAKFKLEATRRKVEFMWYRAYLNMNSGTTKFKSGRNIAQSIADAQKISLRTAQQIWKDAKERRPVYASLETDATARARGKL